MQVQLAVLIGVDMAKAEHYAQAITVEGVELFDRPILNDQADIESEAALRRIRLVMRRIT